MSALRDDFFRFVAQTSPDPLGIEIARAHGCTIVATDGREYLDLLSGIGVASLGHAHPEVVQAIKDQAERYLHAMVYGEYIQEPQVRLAERLQLAMRHDEAAEVWLGCLRDGDGSLRARAADPGNPGDEVLPVRRGPAAGRLPAA